MPLNSQTNIADLETSISKDVKMFLFYAAGYVKRKDGLRKEEIFNYTAF